MTVQVECYSISITVGDYSYHICGGTKVMIEIQIDFKSDEPIYMQLRNQIIMGIAVSKLTEGESLPSVRQLADTIGINMHTVNKTYNILKQEGFLKVDRRKGAIIALDMDKAKALDEMKDEFRCLLMQGMCKGITRYQIHALVDDIYDQIGRI